MNFDANNRLLSKFHTRRLFLIVAWRTKLIGAQTVSAQILKSPMRMGSSADSCVSAFYLCSNVLFLTSAKIYPVTFVIKMLVYELQPVKFFVLARKCCYENEICSVYISPFTKSKWIKKIATLEAFYGTWLVKVQTRVFNDSLWIQTRVFTAVLYGGICETSETNESCMYKEW